MKKNSLNNTYLQTDSNLIYTIVNAGVSGALRYASSSLGYCSFTADWHA